MVSKKLEHLVLASLGGILIENAISSCAYENTNDKEIENTLNNGTNDECVPCIEFKNGKDDDCDGVIDNNICSESDIGPNGPYAGHLTKGIHLYKFDQFPSPFFSNGMFYGKIVIGENATQEEIGGAKLIANYVAELLRYYEKCDATCRQKAAKIYKESEIQDYQSENIILIGTPCTSVLIWELIDPMKHTPGGSVEGPTQQEDCEAVGNSFVLGCGRDRGLLTTYNFKPDKTIVVVMGNSPNGALEASQAITDYNNYDLNCWPIVIEKFGNDNIFYCLDSAFETYDACMPSICIHKNFYCSFEEFDKQMR